MKRFTLIELLIVISIISMLVTLLLPSLQKARAKTTMAVCLSNQKQISLALLNYTIDGNGFFPTMHHDSSNAGDGWSWDDQLSGYDGRSSLTKNQKNWWGFNSGDEQEKQTSSYRCPADKRGNISALNWISRSYSLSTLYSQPSWGARGITNNAWIRNATQMKSLRLGLISSPRQSIILVDNPINNNTIGHLAGATLTAETMRNKRDDANYWSHELWKTNFLFADGSARFMPFADTYSTTSKNAWSSTDVRETLWDCLK